MRTYVYFTKNTEYHVADGTCVRVLRREDGRRLSDHVAVGSRLLGGIKFPTGETMLSSISMHVSRGDCLVFSGDEGVVLSTRIQRVQARDLGGEVVEEDGEEVSTWRKRLA